MKIRNDSDKERTTWQYYQGQDVVEVWQILEQILSELDGAATAEKVAYIRRGG